MIEVEETPEFVLVGDNLKVPLMTQGEWMKGCPEGGEQGLLFQLYSKLSGDLLSCPGGCGHSVRTNRVMFFAVWVSGTASIITTNLTFVHQPRFEDYVNNLRRSIDYSCPKCSIHFCHACGERIDPTKSEKPGYDPLLHCPDLQGVILGMGLAMLEHLYNQEAVVDDSKSTKKRKSTPLSTAGTPSAGTEDDEDDYQPNPRGGKKAKGGTGYAGNAKEDVRP